MALLLAPIAALLVLVGQATGWQNFYTLDDPYIHLAHAALLADGHYGVNPGEVAAASSSVLWPFLLAPFEWLDQLTLAPLFLNVVCCGLSLWIIYILFARFFGVSALFSGLLAGALGFSLNLYGLIFTGMEHSLQVLLAVVVANGLVVRRFKHLFWISITLLPLVRYEGLFIVVPVLAYLWFARTDQRKWVILCFVVVLVCLGMFSLGLKLSGLSFLPSSILAKYDRSLGVVLGNLLAWPTWITIAFCFFSGQLARRRRLEVWLTLYLPLVMHVVAGRTGWFGRYEVAMLAYSLVLSCSYLMEVTRSRAAGLSAITWRLRVIPAIVFMLLLGFRHLSECTLLTPAAARNIKDQHVQIAMIVRDYFRRPVAVNDLGAVAYFSDRYVLDLFGLGSHEVLRLKRGDAPADQWIASLMQRKGVRAAIVYDPWFPVRPSTWIRVATLTLPSPKITPAEDRVAFYAVDGETAENLRNSLKSYLKDHPSYRQSLDIESPSSI